MNLEALTEGVTLAVVIFYIAELISDFQFLIPCPTALPVRRFVG